MPAKYDGSVLAPGFYDLNNDGVIDTAAFLYKGKHALFISDDGKLPWDQEPTEGFDAYFQAAFRAGERANPWNEIRSNWGSYTFMVDRDGCGRYDSLGDFCYRAFDLNKDGAPEAEYYHLFPGEDWCPYSNKFVVNFNGERDMSNIDFGSLFYGDEQAYDPGFKYLMNVHGSGFFVNSYSLHPETSWETPIAWYDFDCDGRTNMTMRVGDTLHNRSIIGVGLDLDKYDRYAGLATEFELAMELNGDTSESNWHSLDMMLSFNNYQNPTLDYTRYRDHLSCMQPLPGSEPFYGSLLPTRTETLRQYLPYLDGVKVGLEYDNWAASWMVFDEDGDDCRWEEMFSCHEGDGEQSNYRTCLLSDHLGDRTEKDPENAGRGLLYVSPMDGKIHLYRAKYGWWEIDYLALFKGSTDHPYPTEGPAPSKGMRYTRVRYFDRDNDGFVDTLRYETVEYGREDDTATPIREIRLADYGTEIPKPELFDMRTDAPETGFRVENWNGKPFTPQDFEGTPAKTVYDKTKAFYAGVCARMWAGAKTLYDCAVRHGLNVTEQLDANLRTDYTREERLAMTEYHVPQGYSRHLSGNTLREQYHNGYWLREKVFSDLCQCDKLDRSALERLYYTGDYQGLAAYVDRCFEHPCNFDSDMQPQKQVILLNGPSSSGKSTLSKALQALIQEARNQQYAIVSIDDFMKLSPEETIYEDDVFEISGALCASVLELLKTAPGVIIDHVITSERIFRQLTDALESYSLRTVHVTCPLPVLQSREQARKNRCPGSAEASFIYLYPKNGYDLTVDTSANAAVECAAKIVRALL